MLQTESDIGRTIFSPMLASKEKSIGNGRLFCFALARTPD
jgi:hypothetical protein